MRRRVLRSRDSNGRGSIGPRGTAIGCVLVAAFLGLIATGVTETIAAADVPPYAWDVSRVDERSDTGLYTSIALDAAGNPFVSYIDQTNGVIRVAHRSAGTWLSEIVGGPSAFAGNTNLAFAPNGTLYIAFFDATRYAVELGFRGPVGWNISPVDAGYSEGYNRLAIDGSGRPALAYTWDNGWLRYAEWNGTWIRETVDRTSLISRYIALDLDSSGNPHISYYGDGVLRYAWRESGSWTLEVVDSRPYAGWFSRIGLDSLDLPHVAYYDSINESLRYATRIGGTWFLSVIDARDDAGWDLSLAVDVLDRVQIAYYARIRGQLRYAILTPAGWITETVDTGRIVGWYTGIATDASGFPHISYYDWTNGDLKYAEGTIALAVRTLRPVRVTSTSATLQGETISLGAYASAELRFAFRTIGTTNWTYSSANTTDAARPFAVTIADLTPGEQYEYRAEATADNETVAGEIVPFTTPLPVVPTNPFAILIVAVVAGMGAVAVLLWLVRRQPRR